MISVILLVFCVIVLVELVCNGAELVVYVDRNSEHGAGVNHGLRCEPEDGVGNFAQRRNDETGNGECYAADEHADGGDVLDIYAMFSCHRIVFFRVMKQR